MSRKFMMERMAVDTMCHDLRMRYGTLFDWAGEYRSEASRRGYATGPRGRKYLDGLGSSSVEKRKKASDAVLRWLVEY